MCPWRQVRGGLHPPPCLFVARLFSTTYLHNCPARYSCWTEICSPSALNELSHCLACHALAIRRLSVAFHLGERGVAGDACDLTGTTTDLGEPPSGRLAQPMRRYVRAV